MLSSNGLRGEDEIRALADELMKRWKQGDGVEPFLRMVELELSTRVRHARWSWESVARALNEAGIKYQTGRPWTGATLNAKIRAIRYKARLAALRAGPAGRSLPRPSPADPPAQPQALGPADPTPSVPEESAFVFPNATLRGWKPPDPGQASAPRPPAPPPAPGAQARPAGCDRSRPRQIRPPEHPRMTASLKKGSAKHAARNTTKPSLRKARPVARTSTVSSTAKHDQKHGLKHNVGNGEARYQARATAVSSTYGLRGDDEIRALADELATRWRQGDGVEPELSARVRHARWSWESVARALNEAGIKYQTERPWTGATLASKIRTGCHEARLADRRAGPPADAHVGSPQA